ncbi:hypothetical protein QCA50_016145 [Cerrena zonata]|uniref:Cytochrome P450 n=1 Tax=Cerrena zonata TaxID=2478898 RepID=A0AAW0FH18_9APHY
MANADTWLTTAFPTRQETAFASVPFCQDSKVNPFPHSKAKPRGKGRTSSSSRFRWVCKVRYASRSISRFSRNDFGNRCFSLTSNLSALPGLTVLGPDRDEIYPPHMGSPNLRPATTDQFYDLLAFLIFLWILWQLQATLLGKSPLSNVRGPPSPSLILGHLEQLFHRHGWKFQDMLHEQYQGIVKLRGLLGRDMLYVVDPKALNQIVLKDQEVCDVSDFELEVIRFSFGPGLLGVTGQQHKKQRKMLVPAFSAGTIGEMTPTFYDIARRLRHGMVAELKRTENNTLDMHKWLSRTTVESISQDGLGTPLDILRDEEVAHPYGAAMKAYIPLLNILAPLFNFLPYIKKLGSARLRRWLIQFIPSSTVQKFKDIIDTMDTESRKVYRSKVGHERDLAPDIAGGNDVVSVLMRLNEGAAEEDRLSEKELLGQISLLIFAATDTSASALTTMLQLLARNQDVQDRLRNEIQEARHQHGEEIPYHKLMVLPLLDAVCRETLRIQPPVPYLIRQARKDIVLPLSKPIIGNDGSLIHEVPVPKGTFITMAVRGVNISKDIWGHDAGTWNPNRWLSPLPSTVTQARVPGVFSHLMTFNGGARSCIGYRFSILEMKIVLSVLLASFQFNPSEVDDQVVWNLAIVCYPTIGKESCTPSLPINISLRDD